MLAINANSALKIFENVLQKNNLEKYIFLVDFNLYHLISSGVKIVQIEKETEYLLEFIKTYQIK